jgi:hypothetical protein
MEAIILALGALTPLNVLMSIFGGAVFGYLYRNIYIDSRSIFIFTIYVLAFTLGRIVFVGVIGSTGAGLAGTILFVIYVLTTLLVRFIFKKRYKNKY